MDPGLTPSGDPPRPPERTRRLQLIEPIRTDVCRKAARADPFRAWLARRTLDPRGTAHADSRSNRVRLRVTSSRAAPAIAEFSLHLRPSGSTSPASTVRGVGSGRCLDVNGGGSADGTAVIIWSCTGQNNQKWTRP
ncbi:RICIN domain-containing protein [Sphaerisporangium sp. B11E5]|uniref:RICIN domain-containing protein n=1 Tax=Sphaerisporangium sp. B11E5 TaxID=3153563 RepID=UPI00325C6BFA